MQSTAPAARRRFECQQNAARWHATPSVDDPTLYVVDMPTDKEPPELVEPLKATTTTVFGQQVILGPAHHVQSITPIATVPSQPIKKRHTKNWWKRSPPA